MYIYIIDTHIREYSQTKICFQEKLKKLRLNDDKSIKHIIEKLKRTLIDYSKSPTSTLTEGNNHEYNSNFGKWELTTMPELNITVQKSRMPSDDEQQTPHN